jgi:uridine kinase
MKIIGIAGGSGSGKSTIASLLVNKYPDKTESINLDKYKIGSTNKTDFPLVKEMVDWDDPSIIRWQKLLDDIKTLQNGNPVTIEIRSVLKPQELLYKKTKSRTIYPKEILIVEGYLSLWHKGLRGLYSRKYYLDLDQKTRFQRRDKIVDSAYDKEIHIPAHNKYVEPTKEFADIVLDASRLNADQIFEKVEQDLKKSEILNQ